VNLHEYQAKDVFRSYGIPVPAGKVAASAEEAAAAARALGGAVWVVKAQVHAGGRGKAGGVKLARDVEAVRAAAADMLGKRLVTAQTGPEGLPVERVYVESGSDIAREIYLSLTLNRERARVALIASAAGGMDIEEVAHKTPEKILSAAIHPAAGLQAYQARELAFGLGLSGAQITQFQSLTQALYRLYVDKDLRTLVAESRGEAPPAGAFATRFCGGGDLAACRASLWAALDAAGAELAATQGPDPTAWRADATGERIRFAGFMPNTMRWANRPTFQQVVQFGSHR